MGLLRRLWAWLIRKDIVHQHEFTDWMIWLAPYEMRLCIVCGHKEYKRRMFHV